MRRATAISVAAIAFLFPAANRADVIVNTSLSLTGLVITPASGSVQIESPFAASAFAQAQDSLGGFAQQFNTVNNGATSASATGTLANANTSASVTALAASAFSSVDIPQISASAVSSANGGPGSLVGSFEITGTSGPVSVQFAAPLVGSQSVLATGYGRSVSSETIFSLLLPTVSSAPILFYDNPLNLGSSSALDAPYNNTLTASVTLQSDTLYLLIANVDSESDGGSMTPEPSFFLPTVLALCALFLARHRLT
jgi:hypothetical protein